MLGDFITRCLVLVLGYAYPALESYKTVKKNRECYKTVEKNGECYKTVEKNGSEIEELWFWSQYWIIVAMLTVLERIGDIFISWVPMYGELKLALFIYLWHPKTKGSDYVYDAVLRPYLSKHETDIDSKLQEWRSRAWDLANSYYQSCSQLTFSQVVEYLAQLAAHPHAEKKKGNAKEAKEDKRRRTEKKEKLEKRKS